MSQAMVVKLYAVGPEQQQLPGMPPPRVGIMLPAGGRMLSVTLAAPAPGALPALLIVTLCPPNAPVVFTPLFIAALGETMQPMIGRRVGDLIGVADTPNGPAFVFADEPAAPLDGAALPGLVGMEARGNG